MGFVGLELANRALHRYLEHSRDSFSIGVACFDSLNGPDSHFCPSLFLPHQFATSLARHQHFRSCYFFRSNMARSSISDSSIEEQKSFLPYKVSEEYLACQHCAARAKSSTGLLSRLLPWILNFCLTLALIFVVAFPAPRFFRASEHSERLDVLCKTTQPAKSH